MCIVSGSLTKADMLSLLQWQSYSVIRDNRKIEKADKIAENEAKKKTKNTLSQKPNLIMYFIGIYGNFA